MTSCSQRACPRTCPSHKWAQIKASSEGWFIQKTGEVWCPDHIPAWVTVWRARQKELT